MARSLWAKRRGLYQAVESLELEAGTVQQIYVEEVSFPLLLTKQVFINEDRSTGTLYLVTNELTLEADHLTDLYQKRWKVEEYHKSLKQNASLAKSPTRTPITQRNHFFAAVCAFIKLETLRREDQAQPFCLEGAALCFSPTLSLWRASETRARPVPESYSCVT